jgi:hypothetical protein
MTPRTQSLLLGTILGFTIGAVWFGYARAGTHPCTAVSQAYTITHNHYRGVGKEEGLLSFAESAGIAMAAEVAETYGVSCYVEIQS